MQTTTLLIIAAVLLLAWLLLRRRKPNKREEAREEPSRTESSKYHAVSIRFGEKACGAARAMSGRRFLSNLAPRLPLDGCDAADCSCRFTHHNDRRTGKDRRSPFGPGGLGGDTGSFQEERRERSDRREDADTDLY